MMRMLQEREVSMYHTTEKNDDSPSRKAERVLRRARGKGHKEDAGESREHSPSPDGIHRRRSALSLEDTEQQIISYFNSE
jgi:hypothetical protein